MKKNGLGGISSLLVSVPGIILFLLLTVAASVLRANAAAGFCLFVFLICGISRLWGDAAIRRVSVAVAARSTRMFTGGDTDVSFIIRNDKLLPLIWLELLLPAPERGCVTPDADFEELTVTLREEEDLNGKKALKKRFAFIMGHDSLEWSGKWTARRRGVYRLDRLVLRSGDGLGLTQSQTVSAPEETPVFVVYPTIRPVDIMFFLSAQWDGTGGERGTVDDPTVMRGQRRYENGDPWKRINWRMAARGQELSVRMYETITPKAIHFIFDSETFCSADGDDTAFEEALSLLASLLLKLTDARVACGLSLPHTKRLPQTDLRAGRADASELLTALAACNMTCERDAERSVREQRDVFIPSDFDWTAAARAAGAAGRVYYIARDGDDLRAHGLPPQLDATRLTLLTLEEAGEKTAFMLGIKTACLRALGR